MVEWIHEFYSLRRNCEFYTLLLCKVSSLSLSPFFFSFLFPITFPSVSIHFSNINPSVKSNLYKVFQFQGLFPFFFTTSCQQVWSCKKHRTLLWLVTRNKGTFLCMPSDSWLSLTLKRRKGWGYKTIKPAGVSDFSYFRVKQWNYKTFAGCPPRWQGQTVSLHSGVLTNVSQLM